MNECVVYEENHPVGRLCWHSDGLRWHFQARLRACTGVRYLFVLDERGNTLRLGIPEPAGDGMIFTRILTRQGLDGIKPDALCRAELRGSDAPPPAVQPEQDAQVPARAEPGALRLHRENGRLYVGEPFVSSGPLQLHALFERMVLREIDGVLYGLVPLD